MSPLIRQWLVLKTICSRNQGLGIQDLAAEMQVSEKTIRRDLAAFCEAGLPIVETTGEFGVKRYRLDPQAARAEMSFTYDEALVLYLSRHYLAVFDGTQLGTATQNAFRKIRASLGERAIKYVERFAPIFHDSPFASTDYTLKSEIIDNLLIGIEDRKVVFITYRSERATEPVTYDIHPYRLHRHRNSLYLQGLKVDDQQLRTWKIDRIQQANVDQMIFRMPDLEQLEQQLSGSWGVFSTDNQPERVVIQFAWPVARYVCESKWHVSQQQQQSHDGVTLTFELSDLTEIKSWILSFGHHATVLEPTTLREEVITELKASLAKYEPSQIEENSS